MPVLQLVIRVFVAFVLCHFIGLVAAAVLGFARVPVLSRHTIPISVELSLAATPPFSCVTQVIGHWFCYPLSRNV